MLTRMALGTAALLTATLLAVCGVPAATAATTVPTATQGHLPAAAVATDVVGHPAAAGVLLGPRYAMEAWIGAGVASFGGAALLLRPSRRRNPA